MGQRQRPPAKRDLQHLSCVSSQMLLLLLLGWNKSLFTAAAAAVYTTSCAHIWCRYVARTFLISMIHVRQLGNERSLTTYWNPRKKRLRFH